MDQPDDTALDSKVRQIVRRYYRENGLDGEAELFASQEADHVYLDGTEWPATECSDRALEIAREEKTDLQTAAIDGGS